MSSFESQHSQENLFQQVYEKQTSLGYAHIIAIQTSSREDGVPILEGASFKSEDIDFTSVEDHLSIHKDGLVAGSQFNGNLFPDTSAISSFLASALPESMQFDQHGMVEMTFDIDVDSHEPLGFSGIGEVSALDTAGILITSGVRMPGGEQAIEDGIRGAWYPETVYDRTTGEHSIRLTESGEIANPHGKFEPEANIAVVRDSSDVAVNRVSVVIRRDDETGRPVILTAYPGDIAPPFPTKITTSSFSTNTLHGQEAAYWDTHAFIHLSAEGETTEPQEIEAYYKQLDEEGLAQAAEADREIESFRRFAAASVLDHELD